MFPSYKIRKSLKDIGFKKVKKKDLQTLNTTLTICQFIVVILAMFSIGFIILPIFLLKNIFFMIASFVVSMIFLYASVWFWINQSEICEDPQKVSEAVRSTKK